LLKTREVHNFLGCKYMYSVILLLIYILRTE